MRRLAREQAAGVPCSVHVPRRRPGGRRLLLDFTPHGTPPTWSMPTENFIKLGVHGPQGWGGCRSEV